MSEFLNLLPSIPVPFFYFIYSSVVNVPLCVPLGLADIVCLALFTYSIEYLDFGHS